MRAGVRFWRVGVVAMGLGAVWALGSAAGEGGPAIVSSWEVLVSGEVSGGVTSVRRAVEVDGKRLVEREMKGDIPAGKKQEKKLHVEEWLQMGEDGHVWAYDGKFAKEGSDWPTELRGRTEGDVLHTSIKSGQKYLPIQEFAPDAFDFTIAEVPVERLGLEPGQETTLKMLDLYDVKVKENRMVYEGKEPVEAAGRTFECDVIRFDYKGMAGTMWLGKDELGHFIVKEEAVSSKNGPFTLAMTEYRKAEAPGRRGANSGSLEGAEGK